MLIEKLKDNFRKLYGREPRVFSAPGRVNLIGEHTDYNNGYVLPMAIDRRTYMAAATRSDRRVRVYSTLFEQPSEFELTPDLRPAGDWSDYIRGVAAGLLRDEVALSGADILIESEVPLGAGLSSSAALEISSGLTFLRLSDQPFDPVDLAITAQQAEHEFVGTKVGIMDQYVACLGVKDHALLIDCRSLEYRPVPINLERARIVVCNTMVKHELATSAYNERRAQCEEGARLLSRYLPGIDTLREVEIEDFDLHADMLPETIRRRCNHVITENARVLEAAAALERSDLSRFGKLMIASHESLRADYEVSSSELNLMVEIALKTPGVFGARMTGGGFGGCTVNLVESDRVEQFIATITQTYQRETSLRPDTYVCRAVEGAREEN